MNNKGAVIILYVTIISAIAFLLLVVSQSRFLLAVKRNQSSFDALNTTNIAESEVNDYLARIVGGYVDNTFFPINSKSKVDDIDIEVIGDQVGDTQTINVKAKKGFSTSQIQATREVRSIEKFDRVEIVLALDCTSAMNTGANCEDCTESPTRLDALRESTISFIDKLERNKNSNKFELGVMVYGIDSKWMDFERGELKPGKATLRQAKEAINSSIGSTRSNSQACRAVMDAASIGSAYSSMNKYFGSVTDSKIKRIAIAISGASPNSTIKDKICSTNFEFCPAFPKDSSGHNYCESNEYDWSCYQYDQYKDGPWGDNNSNSTAFSICEPLSQRYLNCALADTETPISGMGRSGSRDPSVDAYAITIYTNSPENVVQSLRNHTTKGGYYNATRANQLGKILDNIYNQITKDKSTIKIKRVVS